MKRFFLSIIMMAAAVVGVKAQYDGQCVNFKLSTGDSIPVELSFCQSLNPQVKDGNIVWNLNFDTPRGRVVQTLDNVSSVDYMSKEQVREQVRKAMVEFYQSTNGDQWSNNTNWCTDKPVEEWFGVMTTPGYPYVRHLYLSGNNLSGQLPGGDCLQRKVKGLVGFGFCTRSLALDHVPLDAVDLYAVAEAEVDHALAVGIVEAALVVADDAVLLLFAVDI